MMYVSLRSVAIVLSDFKFRMSSSESLKSITRPYVVVISLRSTGPIEIETDASNAP